MEEKTRTRVFKKNSPNGKLTVYLGKRDFVDHLDHVDPVDGVVLVEPDYLKERKVFVALACVFRYGREDLDVLGLSFRKELFTRTAQVFPRDGGENGGSPPTRLQERLLRKLGENAHPFVFHACGVDYEVKAFCANSPDEKPHHRNSVSLGIRKVQFAPLRSGPQPVAETRRQFLLSDKALHLEASLDKQIYYHGEPISVNVRVTNSSSRSVKRIKVSVRQCADICLFSTAQYRCPVAAEEAEETVGPGATLCREFRLTPLLDNNRDKRGLALDGQLRHGDTNLASSSIVKEGVSKELLGIVVSYRVKVKVVVARGGDALVELPFTLMHPKPKEEEGRGKKIPAPPEEVPVEVPVEPNSRDLMEFDSHDDDFVFEDFARQRLVGNTEDGYTC
ncbi:beta-arrestin-2-like isoform X2 [Lampetra planeri]